MCTKCNELDKRIARYSRLSGLVSDRFTIDRFDQVVAEIEAEKAALHPEQKK